MNTRQQTAGAELCPSIEHGWDDLGWISMTDKRDAVSIYARLGLHPFLLWGVDENGVCLCGDCAAESNSRGKHPKFGKWQKAALDVAALYDALNDVTGEWRLNIGLRMGAQNDGSRLVTIDVDGPRSLLAPLEEKHGALPPTLTASTGKGLHLVYRLRPDAASPKNKVSLSDGIDVRSEGGFVVAAPSMHYSGRRYRWIDIREPTVLP